MNSRYSGASVCKNLVRSFLNQSPEGESNNGNGAGKKYIENKSCFETFISCAHNYFFLLSHNSTAKGNKTTGIISAPKFLPPEKFNVLDAF